MNLFLFWVSLPTTGEVTTSSARVGRSGQSVVGTGIFFYDHIMMGLHCRQQEDPNENGVESMVLYSVNLSSNPVSVQISFHRPPWKGVPLALNSLPRQVTPSLSLEQCTSPGHPQPGRVEVNIDAAATYGKKG